MEFLRAKRLVTVSLAGLLLHCGAPSAAEILQLTELNPRQVELGDRVELAGRDLPSPADVRRLSVTLRGVLSRPGRGACAAQTEVTIVDPPPGAMVTDAHTGLSREMTYAENPSRTLRIVGPGRLEFLLTEALFTQLVRCPGAREDEHEVAHATLSFGTGGRGTTGGITLRMEGIAGSRAVSGTLRGVTLDLLAPPSRRVALEAPVRPQAERTLDYLGISLAQSHPTEGGLRIASIRTGSPAAAAGLVSNDVLSAVDGLTVLSTADMLPASGARSLSLSVLRNEVREDRVVSLDGMTPMAPADAVFSVVLLALGLLVFFGLSAPVPGVFAWATRRVRAALDTREDNSVRAFARWFWNEATAPLRGRVPAGPAPGLLLTATASSLVMVPLAPLLFRIDVELWLLYGFAVCLRVAGLLLRGVGSTQWSLRSIALTAARQAPASFGALAALGCVVGIAGTFRVQGVVASQGGLPWEWNLFRSPMTALLAFLYACAVLATGDVAQEEPASKDPKIRLAIALFDWSSVVGYAVAGALGFLGGWLLPTFSYPEQDSSVALQMAGSLSLSVKVWLSVAGVLWVRWAMPSLRIGALLARAWKSVFGGAIGACVAAVFWSWLLPWLSPATPWAVSLGTLLGVLVLLLHLRSVAWRPTGTASQSYAPALWTRM